MRKPLILAGLTLLATLNGCSDSSTSSDDASEPSPQTTLAPPSETGILQVATRNGPTTYFIDRHQQPAGPEHDLIKAFADTQEWALEWTVYDSTSAVLEAINQGEAHMAAAGLTHLPSRSDTLTEGPVHTRINEQLVCHRGLSPMPRSPEEMADIEIVVTADSSYVETLDQLASEHEGISYEQDDQRTTELLLSAVAEKALDCTVADSNIVQVVRRHFPSLEIALELSAQHELGWYLPQEQAALAKSSQAWMASEQGKQAIDAMQNHYYAYISEFDFVDLRALNQRIDERLPAYIDQFIAAEEKTGMPADLLAALAYQESHWDPAAVSPTGVRGIMMLTQNTAESLGVTNRLDPAAAIDGGARYLADRHERLPDSIPEPDRLFQALASYNIGRGHLLDARTLARELGKNPDSWEDLETVLPLKADKRYYPNTRYGYARGYEPVHYVQRIRNYRDVIASAFE
ncbi:membrane-bound lytic murein transglycosylase MltF [Halomonas sp. CH40]